MDVEANQIGWNECDNAYRSMNGVYLNNKQLCAGANSETNSCIGDAGKFNYSIEITSSVKYQQKKKKQAAS